MKSLFSLPKGKALTHNKKPGYSPFFISSWVAAVLLLTGCSQPQEEHKEVVRPVKLFKVESSNAGNLRQFPAKVYASEEAEMSFRIPGELVEFPVKQAEEVRKGQLLARLDDRDIRNELAARQADYDLAKTEYGRIKSLHQKKMVSQSELDNASARLKSAGAALELAKDKLEYSVLTAPFDGRVAQTLVENHQFVQAQQAILILQGSNTLDVSIQIPESIVSGIRKEDVDFSYQPVVTFAGKPGAEYKVSYKEHATRVTPGTQSYEAVFTLPVPEDLTVYPGMGATLTMDLAKVSPAANGGEHFVVPLSAVLKDNSTGKEQVWVYDEQNNTVHPVAVTVGTILQSGIELTSGLKGGERIVSAGVNRLRPGMKVRPLQRERGAVTMNIAEYSIRNKVVSWMFVVLLLIGGTISFFGLGKLEFPEFPIPQAMVNTAYPGASPQQVEEEVTLPLERAILELEYVKNIDSVSSAGLSQIMIELKDEFTASDQPQIWDELRSQVNDAQSSMPPGVLPSIVNDDFSDVFGILLNISGRDFNYRELENYGDFLQRELSQIDGVKKVSLAGTVDEQVVIEISQPKAAALGVDPAYIFSLIQNQNVVSNAGKMFIDGFSVRIHPTGEFRDISELKQLLVSTPGTTELIYLGDIADVYTTFDDTPQNLYRSNGEQAISLGIAFAKGVNVVDVGEAVNVRLAELESSRPVGIDVTFVYDQPEVVRASVNGFLVSLAQAIAIVIVVLLFAMGLRAGLLMGGILLLTILGTFIGMKVLGVDLQLISLGALIIALGMLVDNAIVVTEGVLVGLQRGLSRMAAIKQVVAQNQWPLLGATVIAIIAFAPIGLSPDTTGDFMVSLFQVLLLSLMISWVLAITLTPFFCHRVFREPSEAMVGSESDPYKGALFSFYRWFLNKALKHRMVSLALTVAALVIGVIGFGFVKQSFFPPSNTPIFFVDVWMQEGSDIRTTEKAIRQLEQEVLAYEGVKNVTSVVGMGAQRFILTYAPQKSYSSYGQLIIEVDERDQMQALIGPMEKAMSSQYPDIEFKFKLLQVGPSPAANIEARFYGSDPGVLRELGAKAMAIMEAEPAAVDVRQSWREQVTLARPQFDEAAARRSGISKQALDEALLVNFTGKQVGVYRDGSHLLPIIARAPEEERLNANTLTDLQVWSQERSAFVPVAQVVSRFESATENPLIVRRNLKRVLTVMADSRPFTDETPESVRQKLKKKIESIALPEGYTLEWGGEHEMSSEAQGSVFKSLPMGYLIMFIITVFLFSTIRQPLAIWFTVPLGVIGVSAGLLLLNMPFTFTALLGLLSLSGMLIKNGIVLVEQINIEEEKTGDLARSIIDAAVSRVRPVCMAALTTMLGMIPLVFDAFFSSMAVTIIFGLGFATVLTLIVLPVTYSLLYKVRYD